MYLSVKQTKQAQSICLVLSLFENAAVMFLDMKTENWLYVFRLSLCFQIVLLSHFCFVGEPQSKALRSKHLCTAASSTTDNRLKI